MEEFDAIIIGSGSGLDVASAVTRRGNNVAIVEKDVLGGTCLNRGCIPSKMLIHRADIVQKIKKSEEFGVESGIENIRFSEIVNEVNEDVSSDSRNILEGIKQAENYKLYHSEGEFVDERTLEVDGEKIRGEKVIVASGARPLIPPIDGIREVDYITSKEAMELTERPDHLIIVGGGYVGTELAHFFGTMGSNVSIIGRSGLLPNEDSDISKRFTKVFNRRFSVLEGFEAIEVFQNSDEFTISAENGQGDIREVSGDELLIAAGRRPNTDNLSVENGGIETDDHGFIKTDEYLKTTADKTWALGDVIGGHMFKHSANMEAQIVFWNAFTDHEHEADLTPMPHAIFSSPQVAGVGKTEEELEEEGIEYLEGTYEYSKTGMGSALKEEDGIVKVLVDPDGGDILGCHIMGPKASVLIHEVVVGMASGEGTVFDITDAIHIHPALNEVVSRAFSQF